MDIIKKIKQAMGAICAVTMLFAASNANAFYFRGDGTYDITRYKVSGAGPTGASVYSFTNLHAKPHPRGFSFGIGDQVGDMRTEINFISGRHASSSIDSNWNLAVKKDTFAINVYKDYVRQEGLSMHTLGSLEYGRFKPTLVGKTGVLTPNSKLNVQNSFVGSVGVGGLLTFSKFVGIQVSGKVGYTFSKKAKQTTALNSTTSITAKPGVNYGVYAGLIFNL